MIAAYSEKLTAMYRLAMSLSQAHIHSPKELAAILGNVDADIAKLASARGRLGAFIKTRLPLEAVLT